METYTPGNIEKKWQKVWQEDDIYRVMGLTPGVDGQDSGSRSRPKFYCLVEFPYPSGAGLHVGHVRAWSAMDAYVRKKRMEGYNVLFPMGWDAFGLPAENYAIKMGVHPSKTTAENIANFKRQIKALGLSFDWNHEINTTDPKYYKWTQWIFLKLLERGLAYQKEVPVNWCPSCRTNLADEEVLPDSTHERCGKLTEKRLQKQWLLRITKYADRLIEDLKSVDFPSKVAVQQIKWIGRKEGATIKFKIQNSPPKADPPQEEKIKIEEVEVFTTRPDTIFGATFIVLSPEHPLSLEISKKNPKLARYLEKSHQNRLLQDDLSRRTEKTGVNTGLMAKNPISGDEVPVWVSNYVLSTAGTGAIMGVPGHDSRDFEFAKEFGLGVVRVVVGKDGDSSEITKNEQAQEEEGKMINSGFLDGLAIKEATEKIIDYIEKKGWGERTVTYHLHDWVFSRQHYWGEPIPVVHCEKCGVVPVPEKDLPVELPFVAKYEPSGTGESPLANISTWVNVACPKCGGAARRETDTMPNWAGSNWYYLAYLFANNLSHRSNLTNETNVFSENRDLLDHWMPVDVYEGGYEHTTLHLLYSRFIYKFLYDIGTVSTPEPYASRRVHGVVLGPDNRKMSKSFGNVINPDEIVAKFGADSLRMYEMFIGPFAEAVAWNINGVAGVYRFLGRVHALFEISRSSKRTLLDKDGPSDASSDGNKVKVLLSKLAKKVSSDLDSMKFNTAVSAMMEFTNEVQGSRFKVQSEDWDVFLRILAPMAPHLAEELWQRIVQSSKISAQGGSASGGKVQRHASDVELPTSNEVFRSVHNQPWPQFEDSPDLEEEIEIVVQVDGRLRGLVTVPILEAGNRDSIENLAGELVSVKNHLAGKKYHTVHVESKLVNFVTETKA